MTTPSETDPAEALRLVAIVEMAPEHAEAGQRYEDAVLDLLDQHHGSIEWRMRGTDGKTEIHLISFQSRAGYESFLVDPNRLAYRAELGDTAPTTRVVEVHEV
jgi:hypothetical protein